MCDRPCNSLSNLKIQSHYAGYNVSIKKELRHKNAVGVDFHFICIRRIFQCFLFLGRTCYVLYCGSFTHNCKYRLEKNYKTLSSDNCLKTLTMQCIFSPKVCPRTKTFLNNAFFCWWVIPRGSQRDVVYLSWPMAPLVFMRPNAGEGGRCEVPANENSCTHHVTWSPNKLWRSNSILNLWSFPNLIYILSKRK
jgi:hypothetical protein